MGGREAGMNPGPISERVYDVMRRMILARCFLPGDRLDPNQLAERLAASVTPVREALNVLCGEQLVEAHRSGGYYLPALSKPSLKDMYAWANDIVVLSLKLWRPWNGIDWDRIEDKRTAAADRATDLFGQITRNSANTEHARAMELLSARLNAVRTVEESVLLDVRGELVALEHALETADKEALRKLAAAYHRRRIRAAAALVNAVYKAPRGSDAATIGI